MTALIFTIIAQLLSWYLKKNASDDQSKKDFIKFNEVMFNRGLLKSKMRLDSRNQIIKVKELWDKK